MPPEVPRFGEVFASLASSDFTINHDLPLESIAFAPFEEPADKLAMANQFVSRFTAHFEGDKAALSYFLSACTAYNTEGIDETQFYAEVYRILYIKSSLHLLDGLQELLPPQWQGADLGWLNKAIEDDIQKKLGSEKEKDRQTKQPHVPKKKRPINGFKTSHGPVASPSRLPMVKLPISFHGPATPKSTEQQDVGSTPASDSTTVRNGQQALVVKLPVSMSPAPASPSPAKAKATKTNKTKPKKAKPTSAPPAKRAAPFSAKDPSAVATPAIKGKFRYTSMNGADVVHYGPVFPNRRAVLSRSTKPYIHGACGQGFAHPQDVKTHERKGRRGVGCHAEGKDWNDHPSCKVDYPQLNYVQVKDGYVILDQESLDRLERAISAGLAHHEKAEQDEDQTSDRVDDTQSEMGEESDDNAMEVDDDDNLRAAALGLRKRSRR